MLYRGNEADINRFLIKIGAGLAAWVLGIAALASLGVWAALRALGAV